MREKSPFSKINTRQFCTSLTSFPCLCCNYLAKIILLLCAAQAPAELVIVPANTTATEGNTLILVCVAYGDPCPDVTWLKDGAVLTNASQTTNDSQVTIFTELVTEQGVVFVQSTLEICGLDAEDSGTYYCTATNQLGSETSAFEITVEPAGKYFMSVSEL